MPEAPTRSPGCWPICSEKMRGYAYPTIGYLARHLKRPEITIRKAIRQLEGREWILISRANGTTNRYVINPIQVPRQPAPRSIRNRDPRRSGLTAASNMNRDARRPRVRSLKIADRDPKGSPYPFYPLQYTLLRHRFLKSRLMLTTVALCRLKLLCKRTHKDRRRC